MLKMQPFLCDGNQYAGGYGNPDLRLDGVLAGATQECDLLLAIGTSGLVQPAARIPVLAKQAEASVVQINPTSTGIDRECTWSLRGKCGEIMPVLLQAAFAPD